MAIGLIYSDVILNYTRHYLGYSIHSVCFTEALLNERKVKGNLLILVVLRTDKGSAKLKEFCRYLWERKARLVIFTIKMVTLIKQERNI